MLLPARPAYGPPGPPGKYADTAVPALLAELRRYGAEVSRLECRLVGGAAILKLGGGGQLPKIGERNVPAVRAALAAAGVRVRAEATGGTQGRTVGMDASTGRVRVRTVNSTEEEL